VRSTPSLCVMFVHRRLFDGMHSVLCVIFLSRRSTSAGPVMLYSATCVGPCPDLPRQPPFRHFARVK
jgi:hypothetical protein